MSDQDPPAPREGAEERASDFLLRNSLYSYASVQKGGISKVPGGLAHTAVVTQLIREAWENKWDLVVLWSTITNACGSEPGTTSQECSETSGLLLLHLQFEAILQDFNIGVAQAQEGDHHCIVLAGSRWILKGLDEQPEGHGIDYIGSVVPSCGRQSSFGKFKAWIYQQQHPSMDRLARLGLGRPDLHCRGQ
ncbi:hypothetical protein NHX12_011091 [Muraenolepis orangiensis]|uniref:Uncharacterized protein n=1 Tax=Muraenolepis orangiensis TaxID=630683 RepID=A0A9Q0DEK6_9TELE|nr:hypothetical protein NHX12_011091 [Muraenolepis orangiensis]